MHRIRILNPVGDQREEYTFRDDELNDMLAFLRELDSHGVEYEHIHE